MSHAYLRFRIRLARHGLAQFAAAALGSAQILLALFGPVIAGLLALAALPPLYAVTLPLAPACALLGAHSLALAVPAWLLRKRLLPRDVALWLAPLPVAPRLRLAGDALAAGQLAAALGAVHALSLAVWLWQAPRWTRPLPGVLASVLCVLLGWACGTALLALRARAPRARLRVRASVPYAAPAVRWRGLFLWHKLFWLPLWRDEARQGWQQLLLLAGAVASAACWMRAPGPLPRGAWALFASILLVLLAERGDAARHARSALLQPLVAALPFSLPALDARARVLALAPGLLALAALALAGIAPGAWGHPAGRLYLVAALGTQLLFAAVPVFSERARVGAVAASILVLTAVGGEIWN